MVLDGVLEQRQKASLAGSGEGRYDAVKYEREREREIVLLK